MPRRRPKTMRTDPLTGGLTNDQAAARLDSDGPNELPRSRRNGAARAAADLLREPMIVLLLGAGGMYFLLGELRDAVVLGISIFAVAGLSIAQNLRTEKSLERLRDLSSPRAGVIREGRPVRIPGREVVRGDLLLVAEGDRIAADGTVVWQSNLSVDEALLTGESVAIA
jgi:Ca2+-transporting ATPase